MRFYGGALGLELAQTFPERKAAFYWIGGRGKSMLGLWQAGSAPMSMSLHLAFAVDLQDLLHAPERLQAAGIAPLDFDGNRAAEPVVLAWMPAASIYFRDPDGHLLEYITMLTDAPQLEMGVVPWSEWQRRSGAKP